MSIDHQPLPEEEQRLLSEVKRSGTTYAAKGGVIGAGAGYVVHRVNYTLLAKRFAFTTRNHLTMMMLGGAALGMLMGSYAGLSKKRTTLEQFFRRMHVSWLLRHVLL